MKRRSFFLRLYVGNLLLVGLIITLGLAVSYTYLDIHYQRRQVAQQEHLLSTLRAYYETLWSPAGPPPDLQVRTVGLARQIPGRITLIAPDGQVLADSQADPAKMALHRTPTRPEILAALTGHSGAHARLSETLNVRFRYAALPIAPSAPDSPPDPQPPVLAAVRLALPIQSLVAGGGFIWRALLWAGLAALAADALLALLVSWVWSVPLRQISHAARRLAAGDLSTRLSMRGSREVQDLAQALNDMRSSIAEQIETIASQREHLQTVLANLSEGVLALDDEGHIRLLNHAALAMLAPGTAEAAAVGQHLQSVVRIAEVANVLPALAANRPVHKQVEIDRGGKRLTLELASQEIPTGRPGGLRYLLVVRDVTDLARTAQMKAEFVANASHELRTPLATIRAAADSLTAIDPGDVQALQKFADILDRHVRRLENMTNDLLDLHLVEQARNRLRLEDLPLEHLVEWTEGHFAPRAADKGVVLTIESNKPTQRFRCDRTLLRLITQNLVDNGIKFTPAGGHVGCRIDHVPEGVCITVSDTGCGIPPTMQDRVFERFFQVDPSRSGDNGGARGTGLGLSIVRHATERLGGRVTLRSTPGQGTTIRVVLPEPPPLQTPPAEDEE